MMKSLFRGLEERLRDETIKSNLMQEIKKTVRELLEEHQEEGLLRSVDASNTLCTTLEAIFIHGLKETLVSKFSSVMAGPDQVPEPEFWSLILVFSHRDLIQQIQKLSQITTDIGRSRAWIRLVLNEALLPSYTESISAQNSALAPYYKKNAFLRDSAMLKILQKEVNSVSNVVFEFPTNSCLLNYWPTPPLLLAGMWTPPIKLTAPGAEKTEEATDLAAEMGEELNEEHPITYPSFEPPVLYDEDEALKIILGTPVQDSLLKHFQERKVSKSVETSESSTQIDINEGLYEPEKQELPHASGMEIQTDTLPTVEDIKSEETNIEHPKTEINSTETDIEFIETDIKSTETDSRPLEIDKLLIQDVEEKRDKVNDVREPEVLSSYPVQRRESNNSESYDVLIKNYNPSKKIASPTERQSNLDNILQTYDLMTDIVNPPGNKPQDQMSASFMIEQELKSMVDHLGKLVLETGLISQDFKCKRCSQHIGVTFASFKVCGLTGHYYCIECFDEKESVIPARILHNWDFSKHPVSGKAYMFLSDVQAHPLIDIRKVNPKLYLIVPEMEKLQKQRMSLNLLRMYLKTCHEPVIEAVKKQLWPREYLYEHIHLYSISDLLEIPSSSLLQILSEVIKFCESHVINCQLCSQKGFICEVCNSKQIIFPFHLDSTYRCPRCGIVIHVECRMQVDECPKCRRIRGRTN